MTSYQFHDPSDAPIDAYFEMQGRELILHSRGGAKGTPNAQNTDYGPGLSFLLERIYQSGLKLLGVWVDSNRVKLLPKGQRLILFPEDTELSPTELFTKLSDRMAAFARKPNSRGSGNRNKRLRFAFAGNLSGEWIAWIAGRGQIDAVSSQEKKLPAAVLNLVSDNHIINAVQRLLSQSVKHSFGQSRLYDVITYDGVRLPPKTVFGLAATEALGFEVRSHHFVGGQGTPCFNAIIAADYRIVRKDESLESESVPLNPNDREWVEGSPKLVTHFRRERNSGIAGRKKEEFKREHGRLLCECCKLDPVVEYGQNVGEACIEVHHKIPLANLQPASSTRLRDLMCVCANCHRVIHRKLRTADHSGS